MIEIGTLKRKLDCFPDNYMVAAIEDDECSILGIYMRTKFEPKPIGYISTLGGLVATFNADGDAEEIEGNELPIDTGVLPVPCGKLLPSLEGSFSHNTDDTSEWLRVYCPSCGSDNVCCLNLEDYPEGRWFCISCHDSWVYELEE